MISPAFASHLDCVGVSQLMRREPATIPGRHGDTPELRAHSGRRPVTAARRVRDDAQQRPDGQLA